MPDPAGSAEEARTWGPKLHLKPWSVRLTVENGNDFDGLNRLGGQLLLDTTSRFGLLTNWNYFHERLGQGRSDETVIGDTNLVFRFAQHEMAGLRAGAGFRMLADRQQTDFGFNFHYGGDFFPVQPVILSGSVDLGNLGSAFVVHGRGTVGVIHCGLEIFAGYDYLRIGSADLHGPLLGLRLWF